MENWIAYNKEYADLQQIAEHFKLDLKELQKNIEITPRKNEKNLTSIIKKMRKYNSSYQGETLTIQQIMDMSGLSKSIIEKRLARKWPVSRIIDTPIRSKEKTESFTVDGKEYNSLQKAAIDYNMPPSTLLYRVRKKGLTPEQAIHMEKYNKSKKL